MSNEKYQGLLLENQLCFPLYAASREIIKRYKPFLDEIGLTYTQYLAMMILWERKSVTACDMGKMLFLDSGTLTPLLKSMENAGLVLRERCKADERCLTVTVTEKGMSLREAAAEIPGKMARCVGICPEDASALYDLLYKILGKASSVSENANDNR